MKLISTFLIIFSSTFLLNSCNKIMPASFWNEMQEEKIVENFSDQGPYGGTRIIEWKNLDVNSNISKFLKFAKENEWKLVDSLYVQNKKLNEQDFIKLDDYSIEIIQDEIIPYLSSNDSKIYIYSTGWVRIKPGNETETDQK